MTNGTDRRTGRLLRPRLTRLATAGSAVAIGSGDGGSVLAAAGAAPGAGLSQGSPMSPMRAAASEFGVPAGLLLAISYDQTRWIRPGGSPSIDGGYGLMDLTARTFPAQDWRGTPASPGGRTVSLNRTHYTLAEAAQLLHLSAATLQTSDRQNIRGAAALLAHYARQLSGGPLPATGWPARRPRSGAGSCPPPTTRTARMIPATTAPRAAPPACAPRPAGRCP